MCTSEGIQESGTPSDTAMIQVPAFYAGSSISLPVLPDLDCPLEVAVWMIAHSVSLFMRRSHSFMIGGSHKLTCVLLIVLRNLRLVVGEETPCM